MSPGIGVIGDFLSEWWGSTRSRRWVIYLPSLKVNRERPPTVKSNHTESQKLLANKEKCPINSNSRV